MFVWSSDYCLATTSVFVNNSCCRNGNVWKIVSWNLKVLYLTIFIFTYRLWVKFIKKAITDKYLFSGDNSHHIICTVTQTDKYLFFGDNSYYIICTVTQTITFIWEVGLYHITLMFQTWDVPGTRSFYISLYTAHQSW